METITRVPSAYFAYLPNTEETPGKWINLAIIESIEKSSDNLATLKVIFSSGTSLIVSGSQAICLAEEIDLLMESYKGDPIEFENQEENQINEEIF